MRSGRQRGGEMGSRRDSADDSAENKKFMKEMRDYMSEMRGNMVEMREDIKDFKAQMNDMKGALEQLKVDMSKNKRQTEINKKDIQALKGQTNTNTTDIDKQYEVLALMEQRQVDTWLRLKNLEEWEEENIFKRVVDLLSRLTGMTHRALSTDTDQIYRINRPLRGQNKKPRDVIVQFTKQRTREVVMDAYNKKGLVSEGKKVICLREVPGRILRRRKEYDFITVLLKRKQIRYRWEKVEGLTVTFKGERFKLNSLDKAKDFMERFKEDLENYNEQGSNSETRHPGKNEEKNQHSPNSGQFQNQQKDAEEEVEKKEEKEEGEEEEEKEESDLEGAVGGEIEQTREDLEGKLLFGLQEMDLDCIKLYDE